MQAGQKELSDDLDLIVRAKTVTDHPRVTRAEGTEQLPSTRRIGVQTQGCVRTHQAAFGEYGTLSHSSKPSQQPTLLQTPAQAKHAIFPRCEYARRAKRILT